MNATIIQSEDPESTANGPVARQPRPVWPRTLAALCCLGLFALLVTASVLRASPSGLGTHQQLGLPPCGFLTVTGIPCATCGMTTAFSHAANGRLIQAFRIQPAGAMLSVAAAAICLVTGYAAVAGVNLAPMLRAAWTPRFVTIIVILLLLGWGFKIVDVLLNGIAR